MRVHLARAYEDVTKDDVDQLDPTRLRCDRQVCRSHSEGRRRNVYLMRGHTATVRQITSRGVFCAGVGEPLGGDLPNTRAIFCTDSKRSIEKADVYQLPGGAHPREQYRLAALQNLPEHANVGCTYGPISNTEILAMN